MIRLHAADGRPRVGSDGGSAAIWVLACAALIIAVGTALVVRTTAVLARHRTQNAADLVALAAGAGIGTMPDPCAAASTIAAADRVDLVACTQQLAADGRSGVVLVQVRARLQLPLVGAVTVDGSARAGRDPPA